MNENTTGKIRTDMKITIIAGGCCSPAGKIEAQEYISRIHETLTFLKVDAEIESISAKDALYTRGDLLIKIAPLYKNYGMSLIPLLFINGELVLFGGVPPIEKLTEVIQKLKFPS